MFFLVKFIISLLLIVSIISPRLAWRMSEGWKFKNAEPSDIYLIMTRISSVIGLAILWFVIPI